ncbi:MAG: S-layer homology domain-containing protein [Actinobacteria bacterium]|nr:S-layer homology domain-containing protein [Actinomycetota bacterium]
MTDVSSTHFAFAAIRSLIDKGIINGRLNGEFDPGTAITRAEFTKMAVLAAGRIPVTSRTVSFSDIDGHWAKGYIEAAKAANIVDGYPGGTFRPNAKITRAEITKVVVKAGNLAIDTSGSGFPDVLANHWARASILTAAKNRIVRGFPDNTFRPNNNATRAESAQVVFNWVYK